MLHDSELTKELEAIRMRFVGRIEEWLPGIEAVRADLNVGMFTKTELKGLRGRLHKIAGSAGSFGFSGLSVAASELERHLDMMRLTGNVIGSVAGLPLYFDVFLNEASDVITSYRDMRTGMLTGTATAEARAEKPDSPPKLTLVYDSPPPLKPLILVVDDDDLMRSFLMKGLAPNGWTFIEADHGLKALEVLKELASDPHGRCPDLIIMDVDMPEMDGFTTLSKIKDLPDCKNIPIMMLTAKDEDISYIISYARGALEYLVKPIELPLLERVVQNLLRRTLVR